MATLGCDLASVDGNGNPNWTAAQQSGGLRFVGVRAAYGLTPDPSYPTYRRQLDAGGLPNFPYLLLIPGLASPEDQVDQAIATVGTLNQTYFPLALDVEGDRRGLSAMAWRDWVVRARTRVRSTIGVEPLIYTSSVYWSDPAGMAGLPAPELADCPGWWKYWPYPTRSPAVYDPAVVDQLSTPPAPTPWGTQWIIQQYQGDALGYPGFRATVDLDRIHVQRPGDQGDSVRWIQKRLPTLAVDGVFGPRTTDAVKAFQAQHKVAIDGVVGLDTVQLLAWVAPRSA